MTALFLIFRGASVPLPTAATPAVREGSLSPRPHQHLFLGGTLFRAEVTLQCQALPSLPFLFVGITVLSPVSLGPCGCSGCRPRSCLRLLTSAAYTAPGRGQLRPCPHPAPALCLSWLGLRVAEDTEPGSSLGLCTISPQEE